MRRKTALKNPLSVVVLGQLCYLDSCLHPKDREAALQTHSGCHHKAGTPALPDQLWNPSPHASCPLGSSALCLLTSSWRLRSSRRHLFVSATKETLTFPPHQVREGQEGTQPFCAQKAETRSDAKTWAHSAPWNQPHLSQTHKSPCVDLAIVHNMENSHPKESRGHRKPPEAENKRNHENWQNCWWS